MIFNLNNEIDRVKAKQRLDWLVSKEKRIEIKELRGKRTTSQNSYLHLLLSYFALEVGETAEFIKQHVFKGIVNKDIFEYERENPKSGKIRVDLRSSANIDTKEMTIAIDRFKNWAAQKAGIHLPDANEQQFIDHMQNEIDKHKEWL